MENSKAPTCCLVSIQPFVKRIFLEWKAEYIEASLRVAPCGKQWLLQPREPDGGPAALRDGLRYVSDRCNFSIRRNWAPSPSATSAAPPWPKTLPTVNPHHHHHHPDMNTQTRFSAHQQPFSTLAIDLSRPWPGSSVTISHQSTSLARERPTDPRLSRPLCRVYSEAEA